MATIGLNHYNLRAPRAMLEALKDFYCEVVGLVPGERPDFPFFGYWLYAGGAPVLHLVEAPAEEAHGPQVAGTFDHAAFTCTEMRATAAKLDAMGIAYRRALVPGTRSAQFFLQDPAGNGVELNFADAEH